MNVRSWRRLHPTWWGTLLAVLGVGAFLVLGNWQLRRAEERRQTAYGYERALRASPLELNVTEDAAERYAHQRVRATGEFDARKTFFLAPRVRNGRLGFEVVTPLRLDGTRTYVLVLRGWVPADGGPDVPPHVRTPAGAVQVEGVALRRVPQWWEADDRATPNRVLQNLRLDVASRLTGLALMPVMLEQHSTLDDGLLRDWPKAGSGAEKNEMYAMQWYSLAALALILWFVLSLRRNEHPSN